MKPAMNREMLTNVPASDKNRATLLYPIVPKGIETDQCESIFSYLSRLATAHHISIARLVQYLDEMGGRKRSRHFAHLSQGKSSQEDSFIPALIAATGRSEVSGCTLASLSRTVHFHRTFRSDTVRHCPMCVSDTPFPGAWNRLIWEMQFVEACPTHSRLLINSACGRVPEQWVYADGRALRPGVCRRCGTIAFGCLSDQTHPATATQRWVAVEVGKLIAAASAGEQFTLEALLDGVQSAIKTGWRNCAEADRALGFGEGHFRLVLNAKCRLDFRFLIALGSHVDVEPISILRGQLQTTSVRIEPIVVDRKGRRIAKSRVDIERLLLVILDESRTFRPLPLLKNWACPERS